MYNFYQSQLRQYINREIYRKPVWLITIGDQVYQYIVKRKSILGVTMNWYQILGIDLPLSWLTDPEQFREWVMKVCRTQFASQGDCFIQLWCINQLWVDIIDNTKSDTYRAQRDDRRRQQGSAMMRLWWYDALVENMPAATIMIDLTKSMDVLRSDLSRSTRTHISKAQKLWLRVETASLEDRDTYYNMWLQTGDTKWFAIQSRECYDALCDYLRDSKQWHLYVVRDADTIVAWAICVLVDNVYVYLYGATRRGIGHLWHAQLLHWTIMQSAKEQWFTSYDLLWCAPWSLQPHHLDGVTQFKSWFGGQKIEYLGNYDFPLSNWKYEIFKCYRRIK